jgi:multidrug transporter EmrE-like cation transporter
MQYLLLGIAIEGELIGMTFLKYSEGYTKLVPTVLSIGFYGICFYRKLQVQVGHPVAENRNIGHGWN